MNAKNQAQELWIDVLRHIFDKGFQAGEDIVLQRQFEDVEVYDRYRERVIKDATHVIKDLMNAGLLKSKPDQSKGD
jgi:hypothetical protein